MGHKQSATKLSPSCNSKSHKTVKFCKKILRQKTPTFIAGFWILDTGFWILDIGFWKADSGSSIMYQVSSIKYPVSSILYPVSSIQYQPKQ